MMLVPTLQNAVVQVAIAQGFWDNHQKCQEGLDAQWCREHPDVQDPQFKIIFDEVKQ